MKQKQLNLNSKEINKKKFAIKLKLFNKSLYAAAIFSMLFFVIGVTLITVAIIWLGVILIFIAFLQLLLEIYIFYKLNYSNANLNTILRFKKSWLFFLLTGNITGALYISILITKK